MSNALPQGFDALEPLVARWVLSDSEARCRMRQLAPMAEIREFYAAMLPHAERAVEYLKGIELGAMPEQAETLMKLMLSLAEMGPAVEWYGQPQVYDGFDVMKLCWVAQISDTERQFPIQSAEV